MIQKKNIVKKGKSEISLSREEADELQMIVDRLAVQNPEGESFVRYLQSLGSALAGRPHMAVVLVEKLSRSPNPTGFLTFRALQGLIEDSPYRRHLKQAAYRFSQRGFSAAEKEAPPEKVVLIQGETRNPVAHLLLVPGTLWLVSALIPEGGPHYHLISAFLEDDFETFNVKIGEGSQKFYRDYLQTVSQHARSKKAVEIPVPHAARLFFDMLDFWTGKGYSAELERGREIFRRYHVPDGKPYAYELMAEIDEPERHLPDIDVEKLVEGMDLSWLRFAKEDLATVREKMKELDSPILVISREIQLERTRALIRNAADRLCTGRTRFLFRRFFEEQATAFKLLSIEEEAKWAWTLAQHFAGDSPAGENPIAYQMVLQSIRYYWPDDMEAEHTESEHHHERRTESGIILP